jgi:argonaute-like protein implicated in RNA metabolism and viral defense
MNPWLIVGAKTYKRGNIHLDVEDYFRRVGNYRGCLFVDMKQIIAKRMYKEGITYDAIKLALNLTDHSSVVHLVKYRKKSSDYQQVKKYLDEWILRGVYPYTIVRGSGNTEPHEGFNYLFKLIKL